MPFRSSLLNFFHLNKQPKPVDEAQFDVARKRLSKHQNELSEATDALSAMVARMKAPTKGKGNGRGRRREKG